MIFLTIICITISRLKCCATLEPDIYFGLENWYTYFSGIVCDISIVFIFLTFHNSVLCECLTLSSRVSIAATTTSGTATTNCYLKI